MKFETQLKKLEEILAKLEMGELTLDESVKLYTDGVKLAAECKEELDDAKLKVSMVTELK